MLALSPAAREVLRPDLATAVGGVYLFPVVLLTASAAIAFRALRPVDRERLDRTEEKA
jgi:hypothetical protein